MIRKFSSEQLLDDFGLIYDIPSDEYQGRVEQLEDTLVSSSKRGQVRQIIFKFDNNYYKCEYTQDDSYGCSWNNLKEVECTEVVPEERKIIMYVNK